MTNRREKISGRAAELAKKMLRRMDTERGSNTPMDVFTDELTTALTKEFDAGFKVGKQVGLRKQVRQADRTSRN